MAESYKARVGELNTYLAKVHKGAPDVMAAFGQLAKAAGKEGALDKKTKELIALGIAIAVKCDGCIGFHTKALAALGTTREEINEVCGMSVYMGGGPSLMYAADAQKAFEEFSGE
jgi:AhpD family alkylhydroperoxidase